MQGLLADMNMTGQVRHIQSLLTAAGVWELLADSGLRFASFAGVGLDPRASDRAVWEYCQRERWVLFTANRNHDGPDSLEAVLIHLWCPGLLPVVTLVNNRRFGADPRYAAVVANQTADVLFGVAAAGEYCDRPRVEVPFNPVV